MSLLQRPSLSWQGPGRREFIVLMALMTALDAFSIDGMLPALAVMAVELDVRVDNHRQFIITSIFFGFALGVVIYGFLADSIGRRKPALAGFVIYAIGTMVCMFSDTFSWLIGGRVLQGLGSAGPYVLATTIIRDRFEGREMAQVISLIMMIFIGVPMIAPFVGQGLLLITGWRGIFTALLLFGVATMLWFWWRQPETLPVARRKRVSASVVLSSMRTVASDAPTRLYVLALGLVTGAFIAYLSTGQQVFQEIYGLGTRFPLAFASLASIFGLACYCNSRWVESLGMATLVRRALVAVVGVSAVAVLCFWVMSNHLPLWLWIAYMAAIKFCFGLLFGNLTTLALESMGHIAGSASSLINATSKILAIALASVIGAWLDMTVMPVVLGFGILAALALWVTHRAALLRAVTTHV